MVLVQVAVLQGQVSKSPLHLADVVIEHVVLWHVRWCRRTIYRVTHQAAPVLMDVIDARLTTAMTILQGWVWRAVNARDCSHVFGSPEQPQDIGVGVVHVFLYGGGGRVCCGLVFLDLYPMDAAVDTLECENCRKREGETDNRRKKEG